MADTEVVKKRKYTRRKKRKYTKRVEMTAHPEHLNPLFLAGLKYGMAIAQQS